MLDFNEADAGAEQADAAPEDAAADAAAVALKQEDAAANGADAEAMDAQHDTGAEVGLHFALYAGWAVEPWLMLTTLAGLPGLQQPDEQCVSDVLNDLAIAQGHAVIPAAAADGAGQQAPADMSDPMSQPPHGTEVRTPANRIAASCSSLCFQVPEAC